jgi:hypothetical protein
MEQKRYTIYRKVVVWEEWHVEASNDEEAIQKTLDGDADHYIGITDAGENYLYPDEDGIVRYTSNHPTIELYSRGENYDLIWDNTPISVIRENKLNELLGE